MDQAPLSVGFSRQEYWSGLPCPPPGGLPDPGIELVSLVSPALAVGLFTTSTTREASPWLWFCLNVGLRPSDHFRPDDHKQTNSSNITTLTVDPKIDPLPTPDPERSPLPMATPTESPVPGPRLSIITPTPFL